MGFIKGRKEMLLTIVTEFKRGEHVVLRLNNCFEKVWFFHSLTQSVTTEMLKREKYYPDE